MTCGPRTPISLMIGLLLLLLSPVSARIGTGTVALTKETFAAFVKDNPRALVDFADKRDPKWSEHQTELERALALVKRAGHNVPFGTVDVQAQAELALEHVPGAHFPQLTWFLNGERTQYHRTLRTAQLIQTFVLALDRDPIEVVTKDEDVQSYNHAVFAKMRKSSPLYKVLETVAPKFMDTVGFVFMDSGDDKITWYGEDVKDDMPYAGPADEKDLTRWVRKHLVRSEPAPEEGADTAEDDGTTVVVGKTFEKVVLQNEKDVFMLVHAPWCGFCRAFKPLWAELARKLAGAPGLVMAKMDGDRNDSPVPDTVFWESYPKLFFVPKGSGKPVFFSGNRSLESLMNFVKEHSTQPLKSETDLIGNADDKLVDL